jgi:hypothetical protein
VFINTSQIKLLATVKKSGRFDKCLVGAVKPRQAAPHQLPSPLKWEQLDKRWSYGKRVDRKETTILWNSTMLEKNRRDGILEITLQVLYHSGLEIASETSQDSIFIITNLAAISKIYQSSEIFGKLWACERDMTGRF